MKHLMLKIGRNCKFKSVLFALLAAIAAVCLITAVIFLMPKTNLSAGALDSEEQVKNAISAVNAYAPEEEIVIGQTMTLENVEISSAKKIRFIGADGVVLSFNGLKIEKEACVVFDVETHFISGDVVIQGTLTVNNRLYNTANFSVENIDDPYAEINSEGLIICGTFNNDAEGGGQITVIDGATLKTNLNSSYTAENKKVVQESGTLMLKAYGSSLGFSVNGSLINDGSVIYDNSVNSAPCSTAVAANFIEADNLNAVSSGTYVVYAQNAPEKVVELSVAKELAADVNLLAFGKITFKSSSSGTSSNNRYTVSSTVSLGGGVDSGRTFTQGVNELIFDGGANWTHGAEAYKYGTISQTSTVIFYGDDNKTAYSYSNSGVSHTGSFFTVNGNLSIYGGTKITNYLNTGSSTMGGGVFVDQSTQLNIYGGEISMCAVAGIKNGSVGAGVFCNGGTVNMYGGKVTRNAAATVVTTPSIGTADGSADGSGIAARYNGTINLFGGEISYNHSALGMTNINADGGGLMLDSSTANIYGGIICGNFAGGSGGGICAWNSIVNMQGGSITQNRASFGGGIGTTSDGNGSLSEGGNTQVTINGGSITANEAFNNSYSYTSGTTTKSDSWGGYGGGICLGSSAHSICSYLTVSGNAEILGNKAYFGGGLAVYTTDYYTKGNQLTMEGGLITGNAAYELPESRKSQYYAEYDNPLSENGGGVYVLCSDSTKSDKTGVRTMLMLSADASIDSSNTVSFDINIKTLQKLDAPIQVNGKLTGSGLGALVYLDLVSNSFWSGKDIISFGSGLSASTYLNKFVLDNNSYSFYAYTESNSIRYQDSQSNNVAVATLTIYNGQSIVSKNNYTTLKAAINAANDDTSGSSYVIEIIRSCTISDGGLYSDGLIDINKNITLKPANNADVTLVVASDAKFGSTDALFKVAPNVTFTVDGGTAEGSRLTIDGNGTGRRLSQGTNSSISLVYINNGTFIQTGNAYLRNNLTTQSGSAVYISPMGGTFIMNGGVIEDNTAENANGSAVYLAAGTFEWTGGEIKDNVTSANVNADYGVYLSSSKSTLNLDGKVTLTNNVIYLDGGFITVEGGYDTESPKMEIELPSVENLTAGNAVVKISKDITSDISGNFGLYSLQEGLSLKKKQIDDAEYPNHIIIYRTVTYLFDANDGQPSGTYSVEALANSLVEKGAVSVKTRYQGLMIVVEIIYDTPLSSVLPISDFYTKNGYTVSGWVTGSDGNRNEISYETSIDYKQSATAITYLAVWSPNTFTVSFDVNAPGALLNSSVNGSIGNFAAVTYETIINNNVQATIPDNNYTITGFVFAGWSADKETYTPVFDSKEITTADIVYFTRKDTDPRGVYSLTAYANWICLFNSGIGSQTSPFIISNAEQLTRLQNTVNGIEVAVDGSNYYNVSLSNGEWDYQAANYVGYYFELSDDIAFGGSIGIYGENPFSGSFKGNDKTVTLTENKSGLFGYLLNANVSNLNLAGTVSGNNYAGALAEAAVGGAVSNIANLASVSGDTAVGGIFGFADGVTVSKVFNAGSINSVNGPVGGLIGQMGNGSIDNSFNSGNISSKNGGAGGIVGIAEKAGSTLKAVYNTGVITANTFAGGIGGDVNGLEITDAFNGGTVSAVNNFGSIAGKGSVTLTRVYYNTDKTGNAAGATVNIVVGSSYSALTSSKMYVIDENGTGGMYLSGTWTYEAASEEEGYYYPQLADFAGKETQINVNGVIKTIGGLSRESVQLTVPKGEDEEEILKPENKFTVTYYLDANTVHATMPFTFGGEALSIPKPTDPVYIGYVFAYWCTDSNCTEKYDFDGGIPAADINLYAKWEVLEYKFVYELDGGEALHGTYADCITVQNNYVELAKGESDENMSADKYNTRKNGYYFSHWVYTYSNADNTTGTCEVDSIEIKQIPENGESVFYATLYFDRVEKFSLKLSEISNPDDAFRFKAVWIPRTYDIEYSYVKLVDGKFSELNLSGEVSNLGNPDTYQVTDYVKFSAPSLEGYKFRYWIEEYVSDLTEQTVKQITELKLGSFGNRTVYGVFEPAEYNISFFLDGGALTVEGQTATDESLQQLGFTKNGVTGLYFYTVRYGEKPDIPSVEASRLGYKFLGWSRSSLDISDVYYVLGSVYTDAESITLYAKYEILSFTVKVSAGEGYFDKEDFTSDIFGNVQFFKDDNEVKLSELSDGKFDYYTVKINYGESAYKYLVTPYLSIDNKHFSNWDNIAGALKVTQNLDISANFDVDSFTVVFTNAYTGDVITVSSFNADGTINFDVITQVDKITINDLYAFEGYEFKGWAYTNWKIIEDITAETFNEACVVFAVYEALKVTVTLDLQDPFPNDNITLGTQTKTYTYDANFENLPVPEHSGYTFLGWFDKQQVAEQANSVSAATAVSTLANKAHDYKVTLYAHWASVVYTVTYELNSFDAEKAETDWLETYTYAETFAGITIPIGENAAVRKGYELVGWLGADFDGNKLAAGTYGNLTLIADWKINEYTVTFLAGEGTFAVPSYSVANGIYTDENGNTVAAGGSASKFVITVTYGSAASHPIEPSRVGYAFVGWNKSFVSVDRDLEITAEYEARKFTLYLSANGGKFADGKTTYTVTEQIAYGSNIVILYNLPELTAPVGSTLVGWFDNEGNAYKDITMPAENLTLYAHWDIATYEVKLSFGNIEEQKRQQAIYAVNQILNKLNLSNCEGTSVTLEIAYGTDLTELNGISDETYGKLIWSDGENNYLFSLITQPLELNADWISATGDNIVTVKFVYYVEGEDEVAFTFPYNKDAAVTFPVPVRSDYEFIGWCSADGTEIDYTSVTATENAEYRALWKAVEYNVKFVAGYDGAESIDDVIYTVENSELNLPDPERNGYTFCGWFEDPTFNGEEFDYIQGNTSGNITLFAKWSINTYRITVHGYAENGADAATDIQITLVYGSADFSGFTNLWLRDYHTVTVYSDENYTVKFEKPSWQTVPALEKIYSVFSDKDSDGIYSADLYVEYIATRYNIYFYNEDGTGLVANKKYSYQLTEVEITKDDPALTNVPTGKTLIGWGIASSAGIKQVDKLTFAFNAKLNKWEVTLYNNDVPVSVNNVGTVQLYPVYGVKTYTVSFDGNGGVISDGAEIITPQTFYYNVLKVLPENVYVKTGNNFAGWENRETGEIYADRQAVQITQDSTEITLYAVWTPVVYTVFFDLDGGSTEDKTMYSYKFGDLVQNISATKTGYNFSGWSLGSNGEVKNLPVEIDETIITSSNIITFTAVWEAKTYTVTLDPNGGEIDGSRTFNVDFGKTYVNLPEQEPERTGYTFGGWYLGGNQITKDSVNITADNHTLTAKWNAVTYTVKFVDEDGNVIKEEKLSFDVGAYLEFELPQDKSGYDFHGWIFKVGYNNGVAEWSEDVYSGKIHLGQILEIAEVEGGAVTVKEKWLPSTYSITYILNGGVFGQGSLPPQTYAFGEQLQLVVPVRETGYTFESWYIDAQLSKQFNYEQGVTLGNLVLYAGWETETFSVTISAGNGEFNSLLPSEYESSDNSITVEWEYGKDILSLLYQLQSSCLNPKNTDENFLAWIDADKLTDSSIEAIKNATLSSFTLTESINICAIYSSTHVSVTLKYIDKDPETEILPVGNYYSAEDKHSESGGYANYIWTLNGEIWTEDTLDCSILLIEAGNEANTFTVTLIIEGNTENPETISVTYGSQYGEELLGYEQNGYIFSGWYLDESFTRPVTADTIVTTAEHHYLYAKWTAVIYTIDFKSDGGTLRTITVSMDLYGDVPLPAITKTGYKLSGWTAGDYSISGTTVNLADILDYSENYIITLNAEWEAVTFTVYFKNGFDTLDTQTLTYGGNGELTVFEPNEADVQKTNYDFVGWIYGSSVETIYYAGTKLTINEVMALSGSSEELTFNVYWLKHEYEITYDLNGKNVANVNPKSYTVGDKFNLIPLTLEGYLFLGWFDGENEVKEISLSEGGKGADISLKAQWKAIDYTLIFEYEGKEIASFTKSLEDGAVEFPEALREGYTLGGWYITANESVLYTGNSIRLADIIRFAVEADGNHIITFNPKWQDVAYTITYELGGGNFEEGIEIKKLFVANEKVELQIPIKANYEFAGWYENRDLSGIAITELTNRTRDVIVYAKWERINVNLEVSIEDWTYGSAAKDCQVEISGGDNGNYGILYGSVTDGTIVWDGSKPEDAGIYYLLAYYLFDGINTEIPSTSQTGSGNGWNIISFEIFKASNNITINALSGIKYGDTNWDISAICEENATISFVYAVYAEDVNSAVWSSVKPVNAGRYYVKAESASTHNYNVTTTYSEFTIGKAVLTVTANGSGVYGEEFDMDNCSIDIVGWKYGDGSEVLSDMPSVIIPAERLGAGGHSLEVDITGITADNYVLEVSEGIYEVAKRSLTVTIKDINSVYSAKINLDDIELELDGLAYDDGLESVTFSGFATAATADSKVGIYLINCIGYNSANYTVQLVNGYYRINQLEVSLVISADSIEYGETLSQARIIGVECADERADLTKVREELLQSGKFTFVYTGATFDNRVYGTPTEVPNDAGVYYATAISSGDENYKFTSSSVQFIISKKILSAITIPSKEYTGEMLIPEIATETQSRYFEYEAVEYTDAGKYPITFTLKEEYSNNYQWTEGPSVTVIFEITKAQNGLVSNVLTINGWEFGKYSETENSPVSSLSLFGSVVYTYSDRKDGVYTTAVPYSANAGTYWVRAEVAGTNNYDGVISEPVSFEISKVVLSVPELVIISDGEGKNDVYNGKDLFASVNGYNSAVMRITYDGTLIADNSAVTVVAHNANNYTVRFSLADSQNYCWASGTVFDDDGNAVQVWTVQKVKVEIPAENKSEFAVNGKLLIYLPIGFDLEIMNIDGNREAFGGTYTAIVTLKDTENYEWADGTTGELSFTWEVVGINKIFVAILGTVGGMIVIAGGFAVVQYILHKRKKRLAANAIDKLSAEAEAAGVEAPIEINNAEENGKEDK